MKTFFTLTFTSLILFSTAQAQIPDKGYCNGAWSNPSWAGEVSVCESWESSRVDVRVNGSIYPDRKKKVSCTLHHEIRDFSILGKDSYTHRISVFINFTPGLGDAVYLYSGIREASFEELIDLSLDFDQKDYATKREKLSSSYTYRAIDKRFNHQPTLDIDQMITKTGEQTNATIVMKKNPSLDTLVSTIDYVVFQRQESGRLVADLTCHSSRAWFLGW